MIVFIGFFYIQVALWDIRKRSLYVRLVGSSDFFEEFYFLYKEEKVMRILNISEYQLDILLSSKYVILKLFNLNVLIFIFFSYRFIQVLTRMPNQKRFWYVFRFLIYVFGGLIIYPWLTTQLSCSLCFMHWKLLWRRIKFKLHIIFLCNMIYKDKDTKKKTWMFFYQVKKNDFVLSHIGVFNNPFL